MTFVQGEGFLCVPNGKAVGDESRQLFAAREKKIACLCQVLVPLWGDDGDIVCFYPYDSGGAWPGLFCLVKLSFVR